MLAAGSRPREPLAVAAVVEAVGQAHAAPVLLAPDGQHHLGRAQRPAVGARVGQRAQPALGNRQVEALDDPGDGTLRRAQRAVQPPGAQELLDGVLVMALARQQVAVRAAQRAHVPIAATTQHSSRYSRKRVWQRMAQPVGGPGHGQVRGAEGQQPIAGGVPGRAPRRRGGDLVEQRGGHQEIAVVVVEQVEDLRRQVAIERVGLTARVRRRGRPIARPRRGRRRPSRRWPRRPRPGRPRRADVGQRSRRLLGREGQVALAHPGDAAERRRRCPCRSPARGG